MTGNVKQALVSKRHGSIRKEKRKDTLVYISLMALPVLQFLIFYVGVNFRSFLYAFQSIDVLNDTVKFTLDNFKDIFHSMQASTLYCDMAVVSLKSYAISLVVGVPLGLFFSFYIAEKMPLANFLRVALFLPSIISSVTLVTIYRFFMEQTLPEIMFDLFGVEMKGLLQADTRYFTIMLYNVLISFGASVLMYSNSMSGIAPEIIEAAKLDGAVGMKKFWYIMFPQVFGTLSTFLIVGVAGIFNNQIEVFSFFEAGGMDYADVRTFGYYLYVRTQLAVNEADYPSIAALGLLLTAIAVPLTMLVKNLLEKHGFSEE